MALAYHDQLRVHGFDSYPVHSESSVVPHEREIHSMVEVTGPHAWRSWRMVSAVARRHPAIVSVTPATYEWAVSIQFLVIDVDTPLIHLRYVNVASVAFLVPIIYSHFIMPRPCPCRTLGVNWYNFWSSEAYQPIEVPQNIRGSCHMCNQVFQVSLMSIKYTSKTYYSTGVHNCYAYK
jgi:hypothetical protein